MPGSVLTFLTFLSLTSLAASIGLYVLVVGAFSYAMRRQRRRASTTPSGLRVTILKPVAGLDDDLRTNLESFAAIEHPSYELLLGVAEADDPALPVLRAFVAAHPELDARIVLTDPDAATNPKIAQLLGLARVATGDVFVISDANVRVGRGYLRGIVDALTRPGVGLVSSVIAGTGERTLGAALENLQLSGFVAPGVVASTILGSRPLTIGKSMGFRREDLARIGGFEAVGSVLAEDYMLGRLFREAGFRVDVVLDPVENRNVACTVARTIERHTRWAKMRRVIVPGPFLLEPLLTPVVIAVGAFLIAPSRARFGLVLACAALQIAGAAISMRAVRGELPRTRHLLLEPIRALLLQLCWARALVSKRVEWRGHPFLLGEGSTLIPVRGHAVASCT